MQPTSNDEATLPTDGCVVDVVVGSDHAQIQWWDIHLILNANALKPHTARSHTTARLTLRRPNKFRDAS